ncbi:hypothetical protein ISS40_01050 [Candidatus Bathyarchaeota archaeon]|nr:hypothetical protein [Candidatus Bathyarchaeota archaeon]
MELRQLPARVKAAFLLIVGLAVGACYSYGIATGSRPASPKFKLIFDILMLLTIVWTLIWTLVRRAE